VRVVCLHYRESYFLTSIFSPSRRSCTRQQSLSLQKTKKNCRYDHQMDKANLRIKMLERDLQKIQRQKADDDDDDDDDDLDDTEAIKIEMEELRQQNMQRQATLDDYEKNKKWNVDNLSQVKEERTVVNKEAAKVNYTKTGYAKSTVSGEQAKKEFEHAAAATTKTTTPKSGDEAASTAATASKVSETTTMKKVAGPAKPPSTTVTATTGVGAAGTTKTDPTEVDSDPNFVYTYHEFTEKYADICERFMAIRPFEESKEFLLKYGEIILQEHAANYLLLACLEDEMNGLHEEMKQRAKQAQIVTNIAELAKTWDTHPGNVILPFFGKLQQREFLEGFLVGVKAFEEKIEARAITKRAEMDAQREAQEGGGQRVQKEGVDLTEIPREDRLGPGGLDPLEVIETLPQSLQDAFESRDVEQLKQALMEMEPDEAEYHMKRCVDSGLWNSG
jgi:cell division cycle protein 37